MTNTILKKIKEELIVLDRERQLLFAALTCEKLLPQFEYYVRSEDVEGVDDLHEVLEILFLTVFKEEISLPVYKKYKKVIEDLCPDLDESTSQWASYGFDVCIAFDEAWDFAFTNETKHLLNLSSCGRNIVDMYVQEKNNLNQTDKLLEEKIFSDEYMKQELDRQSKLIVSLRSMTYLNDEVVKELRSQNSKNGNIIELSIL